MKRNKILRIALFAVAGLLCAVSILFIVLAATAPTGKDDGDTATVLDIPTGLAYADGAFTWNTVKGASGYVLKLNGTENQTEKNRYELGADEYGELTAQVKAKGSGNAYDSSYSATVSAVRKQPVLPLQSPTGLSYGGGLLSWTGVDGAVSYEIAIGDRAFTTVETYYLLPSDISGECIARVKAVGDGTTSSDSLYSAEFSFTVTDTTVKSLHAPAFFRFDKESKTFRWEKVVGADGYVLTIDGGEPIPFNAYATQYEWTGATASFSATLTAKKGEKVGEPSNLTVSDAVKEISTEEELFAIQPNGDYKLVADIRLTKTWQPIDFYGTFDGNGKTLSGLRVRSAAEFVGFFGAVIDAEVKGLTLADVAIEAERQSGLGQIGMLCGRVENSVIENCKVSGTLMAIHYTAGGLIGSVADGESARVSGCFAQCALTVTGGGYAGGLIGEIRINTASIQASYATGSVNAEFAAGGFVGYVGYGKIENCYANMEITLHKDGNAVGGFIAVLQGHNASVTACYSASKVTYGGDGAAAGFVGIAPGGDYGGNIFTNCYYDSTAYTLNGNAVGNSGSAKGIEATAELKNGVNLNGFDSDVWLFEDGEYPVLK